MNRPTACRGCPFDRPGPGFVPFGGPRDARLVVIGEAPGRDEVVAERPFVGRSGWALEAAFRYAGVQRDAVLIGNTVLCEPPEGASEGAWAGAIAHCARAHTAAVVDEVRPAAVLVLGGRALARCAGFHPVRALRGTRRVTLNGIEEVWGSTWRASEVAAGGPAVIGGRAVPLPAWGGADPWVTAALHPAFVLRGNQHLKPLLALIMDKVAGLAAGQPLGDGPAPDDVEGVGMVVPIAGGEVAFDVETDATGRVVLIGLGAGRQVMSRPADDLAARAVLMDPRSLKIAHNMAFDVKALAATGVEVAGPWFDTIVAAALVQPALPRAIQHVAAVHGGSGYWYWKDLPDNPRTQAVARARLRLPSTFIGWDRLYNELDVWWAARLRVALAREMRVLRLEQLFATVAMPLAPELLRLEAVGMPFNAERAAVRKREAESELSELRARAVDIVGEGGAVRAMLAEATVAEAERLRAGVLESTGTPCPEHPDYTGRVKRTKCPQCEALWAARRAARAALDRPVVRARGRAARLAQRPFDPDSDADLKWALFARPEAGGFGLRGRVRTARRGEPSLGKDAIRGMLAMADLPAQPRELLALRLKMGRLRSRTAKYLAPPLGPDGRIHPPYAQHKALNGRTSSGIEDTDADKPTSIYAVNAQNWPEDVRDVVEAPDWHVLVHADYRAIEAWMTALVVWETVGSRAFYDFLMAHADIHTVTAEAITAAGAPVSRTQGKRIRHGFHYGMGAKKMAMIYAGDRVTFRVARTGIETLREMHPDVVEWQRAAVAAAARRGVLRNPFGRLCMFTVTRARGGAGVAPDEPNQVLSWWPSATASDVAKVAWLELVAAWRGRARMINHSHDSFTYEAPIEETPALAATLRAVMERPVDTLRRCHPDGVAWRPAVDVQIGRNWGPWHVHDLECRARGCEKRENPEGLQPEDVWTKARATVAHS